MQNIVGIGTDVVQIPRIKAIYQKFGNKFLDKNYHALEIEIFLTLAERQKILFLAKRFAGKEALAKALGTGIGKSFGFKDIAIINNEFGAPLVKFFDEAGSAVLSQYQVHVSLSDDYPIALAFAVIEFKKN